MCRFPPTSVMAADRILIFDTTLRDGEQGPGFSLHVDEKLALARALDALGVDIMEAGFPIASPKDAEAVRRVSTEVRRPTVAALARCRRLDLEKTFWALEPAAQPRVHIVLATSDLHLEKKLNMTRSQCIDAAAESVRFARAHVDDVEFSAEDALRSDVDFLCRVIEAVIQAGATTINLPDTVGYSTPNDIAHFFRTVRAKVNAADDAGVRQVECTINGIGERAGNAALEEIVMALHVRADQLPYTTAIETKKIYSTSQLLSALTGQGVQVNKAIVGRNAFAHEAGIHQDGILKDRRTYEIMEAGDVGVPWQPLVLGKHSGRHAVQKRLSDLGLSVDAERMLAVYRALMDIADERKIISDEDLLTVVKTVNEAAIVQAWRAGLTACSTPVARNVSPRDP